MVKVVVISDPHLVPEGETLYGLDPRQRLEACIAGINEHHRDAELCVINGDLTYRGDKASYVAIKKCLAALRLPYRLLMGNHDDRSVFLEVFPDTPVDVHGFVQSAFETETVQLIFLDTLAAGYHYGELCEQRLSWLAEKLAENQYKPTFVFLHHPPLAVGLKVMDMAFLKDAQKLAKVLSAHRNIRFLICGHLHRPISGSWHGIPFCVLRSTSHQVAFDLITNNILWACHEPPHYAVMMLDTTDTVIHFHDFLDPSKPFQIGGKNLSIEKRS